MGANQSIEKKGVQKKAKFSLHCPSGGKKRKGKERGEGYKRHSRCDLGIKKVQERMH